MAVLSPAYDNDSSDSDSFYCNNTHAYSLHLLQTLDYRHPYYATLFVVNDSTGIAIFLGLFSIILAGQIRSILSLGYKSNHFSYIRR